MKVNGIWLPGCHRGEAIGPGPAVAPSLVSNIMVNFS